ncbi:hypothetical protein RF11_04279 [Thelohanellus kitauei]|uniref:Sortilin C-terminal domain-containing protein n=1 Tax=Thelohanellus kitauei TaxID=669202 RepID=A0A0C2LZZ8_THEKT|nr:hypothetical protein RF11_04279 [Thelohanellus kitauei]
MTDRTCDNDDFESVYVRRYSGTCYQGKDVYFLKKKRLAMCFDYRTFVVSTNTSCPCSLEDFDWYHHIKHSKPNYYYKQSACVLYPFRVSMNQVKYVVMVEHPLMTGTGMKIII